MFIDSSMTSAMAPFEGAEDNQAFLPLENHSVLRTEPEGVFALRAIDISPPTEAVSKLGLKLTESSFLNAEDAEALAEVRKGCLSLRPLRKTLRPLR